MRCRGKFYRLLNLPIFLCKYYLNLDVNKLAIILQYFKSCFFELYLIPKKILYNLLFASFLIIATFCLWKWVEEQQKNIEIIILKDLQSLFIRYVKDEINWELVDIIANKNSLALNGASSIYNLNTNLDRIFSNYIFYEVKADNVVLATNLYNSDEVLSLNYSYTLNKDINCIINISKNPNSPIFKNIESKYFKLFITFVVVLLIATILGGYIIFMRLKDLRIINNYRENYNKIKGYNGIKKKITTQFHNYYLSSRYQILAIPLLLETKNSSAEERCHIIDLTSLSLDLSQYSNGYISLHSGVIGISINYKESSLLKLNFDSEIFYQIIFSILSNIFNFIKNLNKAEISVFLSDEYIEYKYNNAFPINEEILKINSDPIILNEALEPFVIGFGSIFDTLNRLGIRYSIEHQKGTNIIKLFLNEIANNERKSNILQIVDVSSRLKNKKGK